MKYKIELFALLLLSYCSLYSAFTVDQYARLQPKIEHLAEESQSAIRFLYNQAHHIRNTKNKGYLDLMQSDFKKAGLLDKKGKLKSGTIEICQKCIKCSDCYDSESGLCLSDHCTVETLPKVEMSREFKTAKQIIVLQQLCAAFKRAICTGNEVKTVTLKKEPVRLDTENVKTTLEILCKEQKHTEISKEILETLGISSTLPVNIEKKILYGSGNRKYVKLGICYSVVKESE